MLFKSIGPVSFKANKKEGKKKKKEEQAFRFLGNISELRVSLHSCKSSLEKTRDFPPPVLDLDIAVQAEQS